jgi:hypothetical protein
LWELRAEKYIFKKYPQMCKEQTKKKIKHRNAHKIFHVTHLKMGSGPAAARCSADRRAPDELTAPSIEMTAG